MAIKEFPFKSQYEIPKCSKQQPLRNICCGITISSLHSQHYDYLYSKVTQPGSSTETGIEIKPAPAIPELPYLGILWR